jgi:hypothetical protein
LAIWAKIPSLPFFFKIFLSKCTTKSPFAYFFQNLTPKNQFFQILIPLQKNNKKRQFFQNLTPQKTPKKPVFPKFDTEPYYNPFQLMHCYQIFPFRTPTNLINNEIPYPFINYISQNNPMSLQTAAKTSVKPETNQPNYFSGAPQRIKNADAKRRQSENKLYCCQAPRSQQCHSCWSLKSSREGSEFCTFLVFT